MKLKDELLCLRWALLSLLQPSGIQWDNDCGNMLPYYPPPSSFVTDYGQPRLVTQPHTGLWSLIWLISILYSASLPTATVKQRMVTHLLSRVNQRQDRRSERACWDRLGGTTGSAAKLGQSAIDMFQLELVPYLQEQCWTCWRDTWQKQVRITTKTCHFMEGLQLKMSSGHLKNDTSVKHLYLLQFFFECKKKKKSLVSDLQTLEMYGWLLHP